MAVRSAAPNSAPLVYTVLMILAVVAALGAAAVIGAIAYNYVTRDELRNPTHVDDHTHGQLPAWIELA